ncbi:hypothetical protein SpCBS45565_g00605 [Spizellomyces sp. 'palustris']|nr:hypothetical protein SpCBS45565_g00605 [Spizellomyces sp. 'palustris']
MFGTTSPTKGSRTPTHGPFTEQIVISGNLEQIHYTITYRHYYHDLNSKVVRSRTLPFVLATRIDNQPIYQRVFGARHTFIGKSMGPLDRAYKFYRHLVGRNKWCVSEEEFKGMVRGALGYETLSDEHALYLNTAQVSLIDWKVWADIIGPDGMATIKVLERQKFLQQQTPARSARKLLDELVASIESDEEGYELPTPRTGKKDDSAQQQKFNALKYRDNGDDDAHIEGCSDESDFDDLHGVCEEEEGYGQEEQQENIPPATRDSAKRRRSGDPGSTRVTRSANSSAKSSVKVTSAKSSSSKRQVSNADKTQAGGDSSGRKRRRSTNVPVSPLTSDMGERESAPIIDVQDGNPFVS